MRVLSELLCLVWALYVGCVVFGDNLVWQQFEILKRLRLKNLPNCGKKNFFNFVDKLRIWNRESEVST